MGDYWTNAVRHPEDTGIQYLRRTITFDQVNTDSNGIAIGSLEAGAEPLHCHVTIITAYNAGTTNTLVVGTVDDDDGFAATAGVLPAATGFKGNLTGALTGIPLTTSKVVYAKYTQSGAAATAGKAVIVLAFVPKREGEGTAFPNN